MPLITASIGAIWAGISGVAVANFSAIAIFGVRFVSGLILNALGAALSGKPDNTAGVQIVGNLDQGADLSRTFVLGRYAVAGHRLYHTSWGDAKNPNSYYTQVIKLSDIPIKGIVELWVDDKRCQIDFANPDVNLGYPIIELAEARTVTTKIRVFDRFNSDGQALYRIQTINTTTTDNYGWIKFYDGTQVAADPLVVSKATAERPWDATAVGTGVAYAVITLFINKNLFTNFPTILYVVDGVILSDPDSGIPGTADTTPIAQVNALLEGLYYGGKWFYGLQGSTNIDTASVVSAIQACKLPVPGAAGMTDPEKIEAFGSTTIPVSRQS